MITPARRVIVALAAGLTLTTGFALPALNTAQAAVAVPPMANSSKYSAIVVDAATGEVLYQNHADSSRYPASISKVMTLYLTFDALQKGRLHLDDMITVSSHAAAQAPTKLGLRAGSEISVDDAIRAICTKSANDMAVAMAEKIGGSENQFAALMTVKAQDLGMSGSHFANASGLPNSRQISTARDIAVLSRAIMRDFPQYYGYFGIQQFTYKGQVIANHNGLLGKMPGVDGLKTGFTSASGYNLAASAVRDGHRLIAVVMGGSSTSARDANVEDLLQTGFDVESRRDGGEKIAYTQALFESPAMSPDITPSLAQGDADPPKSIGPATIKKPAALPPAKTTAAKSDGGYTVQVGAFKSRGLAQTQLRLAVRKYDDLFDSGDGIVTSGNGAYRAQFKGFSQADAQAACKTLKADKAPCAVVKG